LLPLPVKVYVISCSCARGLSGERCACHGKAGAASASAIRRSGCAERAVRAGGAAKAHGTSPAGTVQPGGGGRASPLSVKILSSGGSRTALARAHTVPLPTPLTVRTQWIRSGSPGRRDAGRRHGIGHTPLCVRMGVDRPGAEIRLRFRCGEGGPGPGTGDGVRRPAERETGREVCGRQPARRRREEADHGSAPQRNDEQGRGHRDGDRVRHWRRRSQARPGDHAQGRPPAVTSGRWGTMPRRRPRGPVRPGAHWRRAWSAGAAPPSRRRTPPLCRIARPGLPRSSPARQGRGSTGRRRSCESPYPAPPNARPSAPRSSRSPAVGRTPVYCTAAAENSRTTIGTVGAPAAPPA